MSATAEAEPICVIEGDCLDVLPRLPACGLDAIVTDPPYGITNERYDSASAAVFDRAFWEACARVCKPDAAAVAFGHTSTYHRMASAAEAGGWKVRQMWAWVYRDGMITTAYPREGFDRLAPAMDPILYATRGKVLLNASREGGRPWSRSEASRGKMAISERASSHGASAAVGRYPKTIVSDGADPFDYFALPRAGRYRESSHPNEKPISLMRWLVAKLPGAMILDPFCGSGTTLVAAAQEGRRAIGIEREAAYAEIARRRVAEAPK